MKHGRFEVQPNKAGKYFWRFRAANGEILCHSQAYKDKWNCIEGIKALQTAIRHAGILVDGEVYEVGEGLITLPEDAA